jgi:uncharacterized protein HemY
MARGWESKSVEAQIETANDNHTPGAKQPVAEEERKRQRERDGLKLSRAYVQHQIEASTNQRYIETLRKALDEIEQKLAKMGGAG